MTEALAERECMRVFSRRGLLATAIAGLPMAVGAQQAWPARPVRCLVGAGPGGTTDILARMIAPALSDALGQSFIVENRQGAGGVVAAEALIRARPDGQMVMMMNNAHAAAAATFRRLPYDPVADFAPATIVATGPLVILVASDGPRDLAELVAAARARPEAVNVATVSVGSTQHFVSAALESAAGIRFTHIPYGTTPAALIALRNGDVQMVVETVGAVLGPLRSGEVRALAVSTAQRNEIISDVPTIAESGFAGFDLSTFYVLAFAAGTPPEIVTRLAQDTGRVVGDPAMRLRLLELGLVPVGSGPEAARDLFDRQIARAKEIRVAAGMPQQ